MPLIEAVSDLIAHAQQVAQEYPEVQQPITMFMQDMATVLQSPPQMQQGFQPQGSTPSSPMQNNTMQGASPMQGQLMNGTQQPPY